MSKRSGFTLIELLVVIAIIAILAAILFPVFARARAKAQQNNCLSNNKQFSLSIIMYASDYDQKWPLMGVMDANQDPTDYTISVGPYMKNTQILQCPSYAGPYQSQYSTPYSMNGMLSGVKTEAAQQPVRTLLLVESQYGPQYYTPGIWKDGAQSVWERINALNTMRIHNDGINAAWCDGHAKWVKPEMLSAYPYDGNRAYVPTEGPCVNWWGTDLGANGCAGWYDYNLNP